MDLVLGEISSKIEKRGNFYEIEFPCFEGKAMYVHFHHGSIHIEDWQQNTEQFDTSGLHSHGNYGIFGSVLGEITYIRIINFEVPWKSTFIAIKKGIAKSFQLGEKEYFVIVYEDLLGNICHFTNFKENSIFLKKFRATNKKGVFEIYHSLFDKKVFSVEFQKGNTPDISNQAGTEEKEEIKEETGDTQTSDCVWNLSIFEDILGESGSLEVMKNVDIYRLNKGQANLADVGNLYTSSTPQITRSTSHKLQFTNWNHLGILEGILGKFECIFSEDATQTLHEIQTWLEEYQKDGETIVFEQYLYNTPHNWKKFRRYLIYLQYIIEELNGNEWRLQNSLIEIRSIQDGQLELKEKRVNLLLEEIRIAKMKHQKSLDILIETTLIGLRQGKIDSQTHSY